MEVLRACVAVLNWSKTKIVMVRHVEKEKQYWTLPGGGVERNEAPEQTAAREAEEETGLVIRIEKMLFDEELQTRTGVGICRCFLGKKKWLSFVKKGFDPEEANLHESQRMLQQVKWQRIDAFKDDQQVAKVIESLGMAVHREKNF